MQSHGTATSKGRHWVYCTGLEKFPHYCFVKEVHVITDHKPLVAMISKDVVMLPQWLQNIMLHTHQYILHILYKPCLELYIADWVSCHNLIENQDQEIPGMNVSIHTIITSVDITICTSIEDIKAATEEDAELQILQMYIITGWPHSRKAVEPGAEKYWPLRHELTMIDGIVMKGMCITIPCILQKQILEQLHSNGH